MWVVHGAAVFWAVGCLFQVRIKSPLQPHPWYSLADTTVLRSVRGLGKSFRGELIRGMNRSRSMELLKGAGPLITPLILRLLFEDIARYMMVRNRLQDSICGVMFIETKSLCR